MSRSIPPLRAQALLRMLIFDAFKAILGQGGLEMLEDEPRLSLESFSYN